MELFLLFIIILYHLTRFIEKLAWNINTGYLYLIFIQKSEKKRTFFLVVYRWRKGQVMYPQNYINRGFN